MPRKPNLDLLIAVGGPKSRNPNGMTSNSVTSPDQGPDEEELESEEHEMMESPEEEAAEHQNCVILPPGFKPPEGTESGASFATTVRGYIEGDKFYVEAIGDMPVEQKAPEEVEVEEEGVVEVSPYQKRKAEETEARNVFSKGGY